LTAAVPSAARSATAATTVSTSSVRRSPRVLEPGTGWREPGHTTGCINSATITSGAAQGGSYGGGGEGRRLSAAPPPDCWSAFTADLTRCRCT